MIKTVDNWFFERKKSYWIRIEWILSTINKDWKRRLFCIRKAINNIWTLTRFKYLYKHNRTTLSPDQWHPISWHRPEKSPYFGDHSENPGRNYFRAVSVYCSNWFSVAERRANTDGCNYCRHQQQPPDPPHWKSPPPPPHYSDFGRHCWVVILLMMMTFPSSTRQSDDPIDWTGSIGGACVAAECRAETSQPSSLLAVADNNEFFEKIKKKRVQFLSNI